MTILMAGELTVGEKEKSKSLPCCIGLPLTQCLASNLYKSFPFSFTRAAMIDLIRFVPFGIFDLGSGAERTPCMAFLSYWALQAFFQ